MPVGLTLACAEYDRTAALQNRTVVPAGLDLDFLPMYPGELFRRMARTQEFPAAEMSLGTYVGMVSAGDDSLVGIPVFPSRQFRHGSIFVHSRTGPSSLEELAGSAVGCMYYEQTASVWIRGMLQDDYGVDHRTIDWHVGGQDSPSSGSRAPLDLPDDVRVHDIGQQTSLDEMLAAGKLDALFAPHIPPSFERGDGVVRRLIPDFVRVEADYFARTGLFPIMHLVVLRRDFYEAHPWAARSLLEAFEEAKAKAEERLRFSGSLAVMMPWLVDSLEFTDRIMGRDAWAYGLEANHGNLATFLRYCAEQSIIRRALDPAELFVPETL